MINRRDQNRTKVTAAIGRISASGSGSIWTPKLSGMWKKMHESCWKDKSEAAETQLLPILQSKLNEMVRLFIFCILWHIFFLSRRQDSGGVKNPTEVLKFRQAYLLQSSISLFLAAPFRLLLPRPSGHHKLEAPGPRVSIEATWDRQGSMSMKTYRFERFSHSISVKHHRFLTDPSP